MNQEESVVVWPAPKQLPMSGTYKHSTQIPYHNSDNTSRRLEDCALANA